MAKANHLVITVRVDCDSIFYSRMAQAGWPAAFFWTNPKLADSPDKCPHCKEELKDTASRKGPPKTKYEGELVCQLVS